MISRVMMLWLLALAGMVLLSVTVSLRVNQIDAEISRLEQSRAAVVERIELLEISYAHLTAPARLTRLAERHLDLAEIAGDQLLPLAKLPARVPLPTARRPVPSYSGPDDAPPAIGPAAPDNPPWLRAANGAAMQPVTYAPTLRRQP